MNLEAFLIISSIMFSIGLIGVLIKSNIIAILMSLELILLSVSINFISFSVFIGNITGQIFSLFILTVAAGEAAIGLAILVVYFRNTGNIDVNKINKMSG